LVAPKKKEQMLILKKEMLASEKNVLLLEGKRIVIVHKKFDEKTKKFSFLSKSIQDGEIISSRSTFSLVNLQV